MLVSSTCTNVLFRRVLPTLVLIVAGLWPADALGQLPPTLLDEALDEVVDQLQITNTPIRDALSQIEQQTGLHFELDPATIELMPYGERTRVSITIRDMSVRAGLSRVLDGLGLEMFVEEGGVVIVPSPILEHLGRRITIDEVGLLERLASQRWKPLQASDTRMPIEFRIDPDQKPAEALENAIRLVEASSALQQVNGACAALGWTWRPDGKRIVLERRRDDIRRRLEWPLDLTYQQTPLDELLIDLGSRVGVLVKFEPGVLKSIAAHERPVDLVQRSTSVRQIYERICGNTGLRYEIDDEGVSFLAPQSDGGGPTAANIQQWVRIEIEIRPGIKMDIFVRQDQLPADFREEAQRKLNEILSGGVENRE